MAFLKLVLAFAPWLAFLFIAHDSLFRLKVGLVVALVLSVVMGIAHLHRGIVLWVGLAFFTFATIAVIGFENAWTMHYMGVLVSGALAAGTWLTVAMGKPFTLDYAREHTPEALWSSPAFIRSNYLLTCVWGAVFTVNAGLAWCKAERPFMSPEASEIVTYTLMVAAAVFTTWYPARLRRLRDAAEAPGTGTAG